MRIFVTGASGFVGGVAVEHLVAKGHHVRAMSRGERSDRRIERLGAEPVRCDLENVRREDLGDVEAVVHAAAFVEDWGPREAYVAINVEGTRRMLEAAQRAGARRFVHIGTEAAIVHGQDIDGADEEYPLAPDSPYPYCATKAQAERLVRDASRGAFETIVLRPRFVWGPGDTTLLPAIEQMASTGQWRWIDGGRARTSTTHVDNLVHAIDLALTEGEPGEAYFVLDDGDLTMREMITSMAAARGVALPDKSIPGWLAAAIGWSAEATWRALRLKGKPPLTRHAAMVMSRACVLTDAKARRVLGYAPVVSRPDGLRALGDAATPT
jgi:nucleoside-diphosphate-sugar epimerase